MKISIKKWLFISLWLSLSMAQSSSLFAQEEHEGQEEEEVIQTRPNPMEKTTLTGRSTPAMKGAERQWDPTDRNAKQQKMQMEQQSGAFKSNKLQSGRVMQNKAAPAEVMK